MIKLSELTADQVPGELRIDTYFDFQEHPFEHEALFHREGVTNVIDVLGQIEPYAKEWLDQKREERTADLSGLEQITQDKFKSNNRFEGMNKGNFVIYLEEGAEFNPSKIRGSKDGEKHHIYVAKGADVFGADLDVRKGDIYIGENSEIEGKVSGDTYIGKGTFVETGAHIQGPTVIGENNNIRDGAYFRGNIILGKGNKGTAFRGEMKNSVIMDNSVFPHPSYLGDSICGYKTHGGNQITAANLGIFQLIRPSGKKNIVLKINNEEYDTGRAKIGVIMGDDSQIACNSVLDPGTLLGPGTIVYPLSYVPSGVYKHNTLIKNKPLKNGALATSSVDPTRL